MKVTNLRRKLIATLAAGGMLSPGLLHAANLNTNLLVNAGFENVDLGTVGDANGPKILDWTTTGGISAFAYAHAGAGGQGMDYANGGPLASGGQYYFTAGNGFTGGNVTPIDINAAGQFYQDVDVSTGPSGTLIASGGAAFKVSAFFSSYLAQGDFGSVNVNFLNSSMTSLGNATFRDTTTNTWGQDFLGGIIPAGTAKVRVSVFGTALIGSPDGYVDNVDFQVTNEIIQPTLALTVDRDNGAITLANRTGASVNISGYQITSAFEGLSPPNWLSIADNYDQGNPGPNQVDGAHQWSELTDPASRADLSEADLAAGVGTSLAHTKTVNLSGGGGWIRNPNEDVVFRYVSNGQVLNGIVSYVDNGGFAFAQGDLNTDGAINAADWLVLKTNLHTSLSGKSLAEAYRLGDLNRDKANNHADFAAFKTLYDAANGVGAFAAMAAAVPEPSTVALGVAASAAFPLARRRRIQS
jgi:hypothetical protein